MKEFVSQNIPLILDVNLAHLLKFCHVIPLMSKNLLLRFWNAQAYITACILHVVLICPLIFHCAASESCNWWLRKELNIALLLNIPTTYQLLKTSCTWTENRREHARLFSFLKSLCLFEKVERMGVLLRRVLQNIDVVELDGCWVATAKGTFERYNDNCRVRKEQRRTQTKEL